MTGLQHASDSSDSKHPANITRTKLSIHPAQQHSSIYSTHCVLLCCLHSHLRYTSSVAIYRAIRKQLRAVFPTGRLVEVGFAHMAEFQQIA